MCYYVFTHYITYKKTNMFSEPFHYSFYAPEIYVLFLVSCLIAYFTKQPYLYIVSIFLLFVILVFYRKNTDTIDTRKHVITSPCQGKILKIRKDDTGNLEIVVFLNVHNVHIQYFPCDGIILSQTHKEGEFYPAYMFEKTALNERTETVLSTKYGSIKVFQIAGLVARRIVSFHEVGTHVEKGAPMGLIKFGSQVRVQIPVSNIQRVSVQEGDYVHIGQALCEMNY